MKIKLLACDFDDTLTEGLGVVLPEVIKAIRKFVAKGGTFLLASGRTTLSLERVIEPWKTPCFLASANGTFLETWPEKKTLFSLELSEDITRRALPLGDGRGIPHLFFDDRFYANQSQKAGIYSRLLQVPYIPTNDIAGQHGPGVRAIIWRCHESENPGLKKDIEKVLGAEAYVTASHRQLVDVNPFGSGKDKILHWLQQKLSIGKEETLSIGDSLNDLGLLRSADNRATLSNGNIELKKIANFVSEKPRGKGVLQCFEHFEILYK